MTKGEIAKAAGALQEKLDRIDNNCSNALTTAGSRIMKKYRLKIEEKLLGIDPEVVAAVELPLYFTDIDVDLEEGVPAEEAAE